MKNKYRSELCESLHETAVGLHKAGVISDKEMGKYDKDCLVSSPQAPSKSASVTVKAIPAYANSPRKP